MVFSTSINHKARTNIKFNLFIRNVAHITKNVKFSIFTLQCTKVGQNYDRQVMHGVMRAKRMNADETKIGKILGEFNSETQGDRRLPAAR